jgi:hypothetical protein
MNERTSERMTSSVYMIRGRSPIDLSDEGRATERESGSALKMNSILMPLLLLMICLVSMEMREAG